MISIRGHANAQELMFGFRIAVTQRGLVTGSAAANFLSQRTERKFAMNDMKSDFGLH